MSPFDRAKSAFLARKYHHITKKVTPKEHVKIVQRIQRISHEGF